MPALRASANGETLGLGLLGDFKDRPNPRAVNRDGLFGEDVFACGDGGLQMRGPKAWRRGENNVVDVRCENLLKRIEAGETPVLGNFDGVAKIADGFVALGNTGQHVEALVEIILEDVSHGDELDAAGGAQNVFGGARAASTAADQSYFDQVASRSVNGGQASEPASYRAAHQRHTRLLQEIATR